MASTFFPERPHPAWNTRFLAGCVALFGSSLTFRTGIVPRDQVPQAPQIPQGANTPAACITNKTTNQGNLDE